MKVAAIALCLLLAALFPVENEAFRGRSAVAPRLHCLPAMQGGMHASLARMRMVRLQAKKDMKAEKREKAKKASAPLRKAKGLKVRDLRVLEYKRRKAADDERLFRGAIRVPRRELNEFWMIDDLYALNTSQFVWGPVEENLHFFTPKQQEQLLQYFQQQKAAALPGGVASEEGKAVKGRKATKQPAKKQKAKKVEGALTAEDLEHEQAMERVMNSELADMYL